MNDNFVVIIPARYASTRLPGKPLLDIAGRPLLQHVYDAAAESAADAVYIATDDERIVELAGTFGARALITGRNHQSGTDRLAEAARRLQLDDDSIIVNLQGDEVGMSARVINQVTRLLQTNTSANMATVCEALDNAAQIRDPHVVKVVMDRHGRALYFSRSVIPWSATVDNISASTVVRWYKHIGLYAYRAGFLQCFTALGACALEQQESLEQLRALYHGETILVEPACDKTGIGVDTPEDLERARKMFGG